MLVDKAAHPTCYTQATALSEEVAVQLYALQLLTALHSLRIPFLIPHYPSAPPDSPKLEVSPKEVNVKEGEPVTMMCQVISSYPEYQTLSWLKDGIPVTEQETLQREQKILKLTLPKVTKQMSGKYHCQARNDVGSATSEVVLQVHCEPPGSCGRAGRELVGWNQGP